MPLTASNCIATLSWSLAKTNPGLGSTTEGPDALSFNLAGLSTSQYNQLYSTSFNVTSGTPTLLNLAGGLTNLVGEQFGFGHVLSFMVLPTSGSVSVGPSGASGLQWFFPASGAMTIPSGGMLCMSGPLASSGTAVTSGSQCLAFTTAGSSTVGVTVAVLGSTS